MQISPINNYQQNMGFQAIHPVYHWCKDGSLYFDPATTKELSKAIHQDFVNKINKFIPDFSIVNPVGGQRIANFIARVDGTYRRNPVVRSYYNSKGGFKENKFEPIAYLITGDDVEKFNVKFAKNIGIQKHKAPKVNGKRRSAEVNKAVGDYNTQGLLYVKKEAKSFNNKGMPMGLHVKTEAVRNEKGEIIDYEVVDMRYFPEKGKENPFIKEGYLK